MYRKQRGSKFLLSLHRSYTIFSIKFIEIANLHSTPSSDQFPMLLINYQILRMPLKTNYNACVLQGYLRVMELLVSKYVLKLMGVSGVLVQVDINYIMNHSSGFMNHGSGL